MSLNRLLAVVAVFFAVAAHAEAQTPAAAPAAVRAPSAGAVKVTKSGETQKVDCRGEDLVVEGDDDRLDVSDCRAVTVVGDRNRLHVKFLMDTYITASGSRNNVVYIGYPGVEAIVRSTGAGNEINPAAMAVDLKNNVPFKKPAPSK